MTKDQREKNARIIDPHQWANRDNYIAIMEEMVERGQCSRGTVESVAADRVVSSLAKADDILLTLTDSRPVGEPEVVDVPEIHDFVAGAVREASYQRQRWGADHDAGKAPEDWFWLIGYLGGKALHAAKTGDTDKALHHTISTAAALANWHAALSGRDSAMRPGISLAARPPVEGGGPLTVVQAALLVDGAILTLPRPARHSDLLRHSTKHPPPDGQGFLLSDGSYATREKAWQIAHDAGQPILRHPEVRCGDYLFSEDLW